MIVKNLNLSGDGFPFLDVHYVTSSASNKSINYDGLWCYLGGVYGITKIKIGLLSPISLNKNSPSRS